MPWPDTLNFGQTEFNWEKYTKNLCKKSKCKSHINLFPKFKKIKETNQNWLKYIYLNNDIHLTKNGNNFVANEIKIKAFN